MADGSLTAGIRFGNFTADHIRCRMDYTIYDRAESGRMRVCMPSKPLAPIPRPLLTARPKV